MDLISPVYYPRTVKLQGKGAPQAGAGQAQLPYEPGDEVPGSGLLVISMLGIGGMGVVYLAFDAALEQHRTIKVLNGKIPPDRLRDEARTLAKLKHPNIVRVLRFGITTDSKKLAYFVMEEAHGQSLKKVIEDAKRHWSRRDEPLIGLTETMDIAVELFDALAFAHDQKIIHRDIKPDNVIIHRDGLAITTKLIDFGLSTQVGQSGVAFGTPMYASPEQLAGETLTAKTDLYSAGQTIYEMLSGRPPFEEAAASMRGLLEAHQHAIIPSIRKLIPEVPEALSALLAQLLEKDPEKRPRNARDVSSALQEIRKEFHKQYSLPGVEFMTDPGRAHAALDRPQGGRKVHDGLTRSFQLENPTADVYGRRTLDIQAPTEVDAEFPWLDDIRREARAKLAQAETQTLDKVYLDEDEARLLVSSSLYDEQEARKAGIRRRRRHSRVAAMIVTGLSVLVLFAAAIVR